MKRVLDIPMMPPSKNESHSWHWAKRQRVKDAWVEQVWARVNSPRIPRPLDSVEASVLVMWDKPGPLPDPQNLIGVHEYIADGLVYANIIADDSGGQYRAGYVGVVRGDGSTLVLLRWDDV